MSTRSNRLSDDAVGDMAYDFGRDIDPTLIPAGRTYSYDFQDEVYRRPRYWRDIGTLDGCYETSMDLVAPDPPFLPTRTRHFSLP